jgi:hypothetical protein
MHAPDRIEIPNRYNLVDHFVDRHSEKAGETRLRSSAAIRG